MSVKRGYRFAAVPEWVLFHTELQPVDVRVFGVLDRFANNGVAWPGLATIGEKAGCSEDTARRAIRRLEAVGAVVVEQDTDDSGRQKSNRYHLAADAPMHNRGGMAATPEGGTAARGEGGTAATQKREVKNESYRNEKTQGPPAPVRGASLVALAAPNSDIAHRENVRAVLDLATDMAVVVERPMLPSQRAKLGGWVLESLRAGYGVDELAQAIASASFRTPDGVAGQIGKQRQKPQSVGDRGLDPAAQWVARKEGA